MNIKKNYLICSILSIFIILIAGCAGHAEKTPLPRLDPAAWPTQPPPAAQPSPTPFPKATLVPTAPPSTPAARATLVPTTAATPSKAAGEPAGGSPPSREAIVERIRAESGLEPVAAALFTADSTIYGGPDAAAATLGPAGRGELAAILARNSAGDWLYVRTISYLGWTPAKNLRVTQSTGAVPVLSYVEAEPAPSAPPVAAASSSPVGDLAVVATAHIARSDTITIRPGPGTEYAPIGEVTAPEQEIPIVAVDPSRQWVLIRRVTMHANPGWVAVSDLVVTSGSLDNAPPVFTGWVESNGIAVRSGPGIYHPEAGTLAINDLVIVWGLNEGRSWALVSPVMGGGAGWVQLKYLTALGRVADIPLAPQPAAPAEVASAAPSPTEPAGTLLLQLSSGGPIMLINADGTGLRTLTHGIDPVLSPDGQTVAFTRWEGEVGTLWLINIDGSNERVILGNMTKAKGPEWSPDGTQIILNFQAGGRLEEKDVCYNLETSTPGLPPRNAGRPTLGLRDGKFYLCWTEPPDPHWTLRLVNVADGTFQDVSGGTYAFRPTWDTAEPWRIISDSGRGLAWVDLSNPDNNQALTTDVNDNSPVLSPDGRYLAVTYGREGGGPGHDIHRLSRDGSGRVALTSTPLWVPVGPEGLPAWNNVAPAWSPDSRQIAFLTDRAGPWEIWVMEADGSNQRPIFSDAVNAQLPITYNFVDERMISWR